MKVLVLTSGGDAPGMNKVIGTLYKKFKGKLYACRAGYRGLINNDIVSMKEFKPLDFINQSGSVITNTTADGTVTKQINYKNGDSYTEVKKASGELALAFSFILIYKSNTL